MGLYIFILISHVKTMESDAGLSVLRLEGGSSVGNGWVWRRGYIYV